MSDSSESLYCEIGRVAVAWAKIECLLTFGIAHFSGITNEKAHCMFARAQAAAKIDALDCLLGDTCSKDEEFCRSMAGLLERIDDARLFRNQLQHCDISFDGSNVEMKSTKWAGKTRSININTENYELSDICATASEIEALSSELKVLLEKADSIAVRAD